MKPRFLFPHFFRIIGYCCFIAVILFAILFMIIHPQGFSQLHHSSGAGVKISHDTTALLLLFGLLFIAFSKERTEDEHISLIRLESLQWAVYLNYFLLAVSVIITNTMELMHIILMSVWAPLVFFIIRFRWMIYRLNRAAGKEANLS